MKIIPGAYPEESNWQKWISFTKGPEISLVFLRRLAAYVRDIVMKPVTMYGYRTYAEQVAAYENYLAGGNIAAKPGTSWHGYGLAVDFNRIGTVNGKGVYPGTLDEDYAAFSVGRSELMAKYGIIHTVKTEPWHIQPIETKGYSGDRSAFLDADDRMNGEVTGMLYLGCPAGESVKCWQESITRCMGVGFDADGVGNFGQQTYENTKAFQKAVGLTITGQVDDLTYARMLAELLSIKPTGISETEYDALSARCDNLNQLYESEKQVSANWTQMATDRQNQLALLASIERQKKEILDKY